MKVTLDNYEIWLTDYADGNLSPEDKAEVEAFLLMHEELRDMSDVSDVQIKPDTSTKFADKNKLKRDECQEIPDYYAIAAAENETTENDREIIRRHLLSPTFRKETENYRKLRLKPNLNIVYPRKERLYRRSRVVPFIITGVGSVAALIVIFFSIPKKELLNNLNQPIQNAQIIKEIPDSIKNEPTKEILPTIGAAKETPSTKIDENEIVADVENGVRIPASPQEPIVFAKAETIGNVSGIVKACKGDAMVKPNLVKTNMHHITITPDKDKQIIIESRNIFSSALASGKEMIARAKETELPKLLKKNEDRL